MPISDVCWPDTARGSEGHCGAGHTRSSPPPLPSLSSAWIGSGQSTDQTMHVLEWRGSGLSPTGLLSDRLWDYYRQYVRSVCTGKPRTCETFSPVWYCSISRRRDIARLTNPRSILRYPVIDMNLIVKQLIQNSKFNYYEVIIND